MQDDKCAGSAEERELSRVQVLWLQGVQSASKQLPTGVCRSGLVSGVGECRRRRRRRRRCVVKEAQDNGLSVLLYQLQITIIVRLSGLGSVGRQQKCEISSRTLGVTTNGPVVCGLWLEIHTSTRTLFDALASWPDIGDPPHHAPQQLPNQFSRRLGKRMVPCVIGAMSYRYMYKPNRISLWRIRLGRGQQRSFLARTGARWSFTLAACLFSTKKRYLLGALLSPNPNDYPPRPYILGKGTFCPCTSVTESPPSQ